jgi:hypothetical protein
MRILFFLLPVLALMGCSGSKTAKPDLLNVNYHLLLENHSAWQDAVKSIKSNLRITLDTPLYSGNFDAALMVDEPDSMLLEVTGPFGMRIGKVFVSKNRFIFYNQVMNQFYKGAKEDFKGRNFLQFPIEIGQLKDIMAARDLFEVLEKQSLQIRDNQYFVEAKNGHFNYNIWFDPQHLLITKIEYLKEGKLFFYKEYRNFQKVNGIYFPHHVSFVRPESKEGISIFYSELAINMANKPEEYKIEIADTATQLDLTL